MRALRANTAQLRGRLCGGSGGVRDGGGEHVPLAEAGPVQGDAGRDERHRAGAPQGLRLEGAGDAVERRGMLKNTDQVLERDSLAGFFFGFSDCCVKQALARFYVT